MAAAPGTLARPALPGAVFALRELRFWLTDYRRTWRGSIYSSLLNPLLFLGAMGLGLGKLVNAHGDARIGGGSGPSRPAPPAAGPRRATTPPGWATRTR